jgi:hypothetical protein
MVTYFYSDHWISLLIVPKWGKVWALDSLNHDNKTYKDFLGVIVPKWGKVWALDSLDHDNKTYKDFLGVLNQ